MPAAETTQNSVWGTFDRVEASLIKQLAQRQTLEHDALRSLHIENANTREEKDPCAKLLVAVYMACLKRNDKRVYTEEEIKRFLHTGDERGCNIVYYPWLDNKPACVRYPDEEDMPISQMLQYVWNIRQTLRNHFVQGIVEGKGWTSPEAPAKIIRGIDPAVRMRMRPEAPHASSVYTTKGDAKNSGIKLKFPDAIAASLAYTVLDPALQQMGHKEGCYILYRDKTSLVFSEEAYNALRQASIANDRVIRN